MTAGDLVDILLEMDDFSPEEMSELTRQSMFDMRWTRKPFAGTPDDPVLGDYRLEFDIKHMALSGSINLTVYGCSEAKISVNLSVYVQDGRRSASTGNRRFDLRKKLFEKLRAACQKFVREQVPLAMAGEQGISKGKLAAQTTVFIKRFRASVEGPVAPPEVIAAFKQKMEAAPEISTDELAQKVEDGEKAGFDSDYSCMTQADINYWTKVFRLGESEESDMAHTLTQKVNKVPWIEAQKAWDAEVTRGFGGNPWRVVLSVLGCADDNLADFIQTEMLKSTDELNSAVIGWVLVEEQLEKRGLSAMQTDAIERLWYRQLGHGE